MTIRDLLVCTPSRGRPSRLREMMAATLSLSEALTDIAVGLDDDDPELSAALDMANDDDRVDGRRVFPYCRSRNTVSGWTNDLAREGRGQYRAFFSMSDDHLPRTTGWDRLLLEAIDTQFGGTGIAYGNDLLQGANCPTAALVTADIVEALGWLALPECRHFCIDDAWKALGEQAGCLAYMDAVIIEHLHFSTGKSATDATYQDATADWYPDVAAAQAWAAGRMAADVAAVAALVAARKAGS